MKIRILPTALALVLAAPTQAAPSASHAMPADRPTSLTLGAALSNANTTPTAGVTYAFNQHWRGELWTTLGTMRTEVGRPSVPLQHRPASLMAHYQFGQDGARIRPFIGAGYGRSSGRLAAQPTAAGQLAVGTLHGLATTLGTDIPLGPRWFLRAELRGLTARSSIRFNGTRVGRLSGTAGALEFSVGMRL